MTTLSGSLKVDFGVGLAGSHAYGGPNWAGALSILHSITSGTGAGQSDLSYLAERSVNTASNDDIDLAGVLTDALGATITGVELTMLLIWNQPKDLTTANTTALTIGNGSNPMIGFLGGTTPTIGPIQPGGLLLLSAPGHASGLGAITAGTGDILRVANASGATNKYQIAILARSA